MTINESEKISVGHLDINLPYDCVTFQLLFSPMRAVSAECFLSQWRHIPTPKKYILRFTIIAYTYTKYLIYQ